MKTLILVAISAACLAAQSKVSPEKEASLKADLAGQVDGMKKQVQVMVDSIFSFGELGFQEFESQKYITGILEKEGFQIQRGYAGIPSSFVATWGSGKPVISLGADEDDLPQASQKPGVAYHDPIIEGAPGHGEGHNAGLPLQVTAAIAVKKIMEREHLQGTLQIWPGVAEELVAAKSYYVREGLFKNADVCLMAHVGDQMVVTYGPAEGNGIVSVEYMFKGESAHAAAAPWRGKSALDAAELMSIGYEFRREHLRLATRVHYVFPNGGDQPNVVPPNASIWFYFREADYDHIMNLWRIGDNMAKAASLMTDTEFTERVLGSGWPQHFNKPLAEAMQKNIERVGMPQWSEQDLTLAKAYQAMLGQKVTGLATAVTPLRPPRTEEPLGGGSNDLGDITWTLPTILLNYPSNIPGGPGHNWANAVSMATPIAHKGAVAGAKAQAMMILDVVLHPELVQSAKDYFKNVQTKDQQYKPFIRPEDKPAIWLNKNTMDQYRERMKAFYYDPSKYDTYLEQLKIKYPTVR